MSDYDEGAMDERSGWETAARELLDALPTVWQGSAEAVRLRSLLNERPTEPTEADRDAAFDAAIETADRSMAMGRADLGQWRRLFFADLTRRGYEVRALVGGRPAAPTREQVREGLRGWVDPTRGETGLDAATDAVVALLSRPAASSEGRAVMRGLSIYDEDTGEQLTGPEIDTAERAAAEPPEDQWEVFTAADGERAIRMKGHDGLLDPIPGADESDNPMVRGVAAEPKEHGDE